MLLVAAVADYEVREQRLANARILARLDEVRDSLASQPYRSSELSAQLGELTKRLAQLEDDNRRLRRELSTQLRRKPEIAALTVTPPLESSGVTTLIEYTPGIEAAAPLLHEPAEIAATTISTASQPSAVMPFNEYAPGVDPAPLAAAVPVARSTDWSSYYYQSADPGPRIPASSRCRAPTQAHRPAIPEEDVRRIRHPSSRGRCDDDDVAQPGRA